MSQDCLFCRIARGEVPATKVYEDEQFIGFRDIQPVAPVHVLVIPKRHVTSLPDLVGAGLAEGYVEAVSKVAQQEGVATSGFRTVVNTGPDAQQSVPHIHVHVIGGRQMSWPPG